MKWQDSSLSDNCHLAILMEAYQKLSVSDTNFQQRKRKMGAKKIANVSRETFAIYVLTVSFVWRVPVRR